MMNMLFDDGGHLTGSALTSLQAGSLCEEELARAAGHLGTCEACAQRLCDSFEPGGLAPAPPGFTEQTVLRSRDAAQQKKKSTVQFIFFSLRVAAAVCAALCIVFSGTLRGFAESRYLSQNINAPHFGFANTINSGLQQFSQKVLSVEDFYDQKKK